MSNWLSRGVNKLFGQARKDVPAGVWSQCPACQATLYHAELVRQRMVCSKCGHHMRIGARQRLGFFLDPEGMQEIGADVRPQDYLKFKDSKKYSDRLTQARKKTGEEGAMVVVSGTQNPCLSSSVSLSLGSLVAQWVRLWANASCKVCIKPSNKKYHSFASHAVGGAHARDYSP